MKWKAKAIVVIVCVVLFGKAVHSIYAVYTKNGRLAGDNQSLTTQLSEQAALITNQEARIQHLSELDTKHTQELANAKTEIDKLRNAAHAHPERVYTQAKCHMSKTITPSGLDDAATARPTDAVIRNYWLLRERIATSEQMILGLQE